jgi:superfamily I DNA and RNA helicase
VFVILHITSFVALSHISMSSQIDETHNQIVHFHTSEQLKHLLTASAEQWWAGPAGSGKTVLLKTKVKELAREIVEKERSNEKILVLCYNKPLSVHLKKNFKDWFYERFPGSRLKSPVHVYTYDSFIYKIFTETLGLTDDPELYEGGKIEERRRIVKEYFLTQGQPILSSDESYQHIFVDEGQDFPGNECLNLLQKVHNKPNGEDTSDCRYYFWVFFDSNQHVQLRENESRLWESNSNKFRLTKVLRNTENVFLLAKTCYSGYSGDEITLGHNEVGMNVVYDDCLELTTDRSSGVQILVRHIRKLQQNKVKLKDIVILVRARDSRDKLMECLKNEKPPIRCFNAEYHASKALRHLDFVIVDSIRRFKGLESKVVILYDPPYLLDRNNLETPALLYTAISRCFCYLVVVSTQEGCKAIKERVDDIKYRKKVAAGTGVNTDWN